MPPHQNTLADLNKMLTVREGAEWYISCDWYASLMLRDSGHPETKLVIYHPADSRSRKARTYFLAWDTEKRDFTCRVPNHTKRPELNGDFLTVKDSSGHLLLEEKGFYKISEELAKAILATGCLEGDREVLKLLATRGIPVICAAV